MECLEDEAVRRGTTMSALAEAVLRLGLGAPGTAGNQPKALPPLPTWRSGGFRVDIADRDALYRVMEEK